MRPNLLRATARSKPSGVQSAHSTPSSTSRGAPPASGTRAMVPLSTNAADECAFNITASSPRLDMLSSSVFSSPSGRESVLSKRVVNSSTGLPSRAAPYRIVCPSGEKRAARVVPRRNVRRWKLFRFLMVSRAPDDKIRSRTKSSYYQKRGQCRKQPTPARRRLFSQSP